MKPVFRSPLAAVIVLAGCSAGQDAGTAARDVAHDVLTVDHSIGAVDQEHPELEFGRVSGLALLHDGRIAMADGLNHQVRIFTTDGAHVFSFGRSGAGPGEFSGPCCIAQDQRQRLWVRDGGNTRYSIFDLDGDRAVHVGQVRMSHGDANRWAAVTFDSAGNVIDIGMRPDSVTGERLVFRTHLDSAGRVVRRQPIHKVPDDSTSMKQVQRATPGGTTTLFAYQPFGPAELAGHSPNGDFAHALSSRYVIEWRAPDGSLLRTVSRDIAQGPALSDAERMAGEKQMNDQAEWMGVSRMQLGFNVPSHKTVLRNLFFDRHGRLWVELNVPDGSDRLAHVYDTDGSLERTLSWPAAVWLTDGAIRDGVFWGVARDSLDVPTLVRLR